MKKFVLLIILFLTAVFFLSQKTNAQTEQDCRKIFDKESYKCLGVSGDCQRKCGEETKRPDGGAYFNSGEVYSKCTKANDCDGKGRACNEQALANFRACQDARKEAGSGSIEKNKEPSETEANAVNEWIKNNFGDLDIKRIEEGAKVERQPIIIKEDQVAPVETPAQDQFYLGMSYTNGLVKLPDSQEFTDFQDIWHIPTGSTIRAMNEPIRINIGTKKVMILAPDSEVVLTSDRQIEILKGTIEVNRVGIFSPDSEQQDVGASTEFIDLFVIGTHYWVTHEPGKQTLVGVYTGEVEVKTKDGKTVKVKPNEGKPGVVVVSQKLSPVKLAIAGLLAAGVIGGTIWFIKKRSQFKLSKKKK